MVMELCLSGLAIKSQCMMAVTFMRPALSLQELLQLSAILTQTIFAPL